MRPDAYLTPQALACDLTSFLTSFIRGRSFLCSSARWIVRIASSAFQRISCWLSGLVFRDDVRALRRSESIALPTDRQQDQNFRVHVSTSHVILYTVSRAIIATHTAVIHTQRSSTHTAVIHTQRSSTHSGHPHTAVIHTHSGHPTFVFFCQNFIWYRKDGTLLESYMERCNSYTTSPSFSLCFICAHTCLC